MGYEPYVCLQTNSRCYNRTEKFIPVGVLWHSTGANNTALKRYVQPTDGSANYLKDIAKLGKNLNKNDWNHTQISAGVNAFIGKFADGTIGTVQALPWDYAPWGCGSGSKGSCNKFSKDGKKYGWIQFEICEDGLKDKDYAQKVYDEAVALTAYLCKEYKIDPDGYVTVNGVKIPTITCHNDVSKLGFGTSHADINHWFPKLIDKDMKAVRRDVGAALDPNVESAPAAPVAEATPKAPETTVKEPETSTAQEYKIRVTAGGLNVRKKPNGTIVSSIKKNEVYTIVEEKDGWGLLKSYATNRNGWICLKYTQKV